MSLRADAVAVDVDGRRLLDDVSLQLRPGELHVLLGANGAGKSTLLHLLAGDHAPSRGQVTLDGRPVTDIPRRLLARRRAVLPQADHLDFAFTAREVVALGRYAMGDEDGPVIDAALRAADALPLADRPYPTLSGGERSRVRLARALAQLWPGDGAGTGGRYLLLDEPTAALDLPHQQACMRIIADMARRGVGVLAILHDPNLAMAHADRVSLLRDGRLLASGRPQTVLDAATLSRVYDTPMALLRVEGRQRPVIVAAAGD